MLLKIDHDDAFLRLLGRSIGQDVSLFRCGWPQGEAPPAPPSVSVDTYW